MAEINELKVGQIVFSKRGRDKGLPFVVVSTEENYIWLADGKLRRIEKPKKKKRIHVQPVKIIDEDIGRKITEKVTGGPGVIDADLRKMLEAFLCDRL